MKLKQYALTDIGKERDNNEDAFVSCSNLDHSSWDTNEMQSYISLGAYGSLLAVADGMGGANAGEIASSIAIETVKKHFSKENISRYFEEDEIKMMLQQLFIDADTTIKNKVLEIPDTSGMGTTLVLCWMIGGKAYVAWCGDSRCYIYNPIMGLNQITKDHSYVQEMVDKGEIKAKDAFMHPDGNIITKGLGDFEVDDASMPDIISINIKPNDLLLLCSDGLCGFCENSLIEKVIDRNYLDVNRCGDELLQIALEAGGYDNITIAIASLISDNEIQPHKLSFLEQIEAFISRKCHRRR